MAFEQNMIYLPHTSFDYEKASMGPYYYSKYNTFHVEGDIEIDPQYVIDKFPKAITSYWNNTKQSTSTSLAFLREDGYEFAIRFLHNNSRTKYGDIIAYWIFPTCFGPSSWVPHLERKEYSKFVEYLVKSKF